jgi:hypothetical protein
MIMHRKITTGVVTAIALVASLGFALLMSSAPASARAHRHANPAQAFGAASCSYAASRNSNDIPFAPF